MQELVGGLERDAIAPQTLPLIRQAGVEAVFVTDQMDVFCSEGLRGNFELLVPSQD